ncbi:MAG TPA: hypothetical protein VES42_05600 [Pilimelia sp.]|nr:hypothetical protein [Pilimelia sp.]
MSTEEPTGTGKRDAAAEPPRGQGTPTTSASPKPAAPPPPVAPPGAGPTSSDATKGLAPSGAAAGPARATATDGKPPGTPADKATGKATDTPADKAPGTAAEKAPGEAADRGPGKVADNGGAPATEKGAASAAATDPWDKFAPAPLPTVSRPRRLLAAMGRACAHEWTLASLAGLLLAVVMTWPTLRYPAYTIPQDIWDPTLQAWQMAWSGHILTTDPGQLWHANAFFPDRYTFAFSDTLLGYAPAGLIGDGPVAALIRYNIMYVLVHALAFVGAYALVRQLGAGRTGAAVAGAAFAYAPWRLAQAGHMHVLSTGGIALALAMLARGHGWSLRHGYRPARRHAGWAFAGWLVAAWQISLGFGIGLPFAYALAVVVVVSVIAYVIRRTWFWGVRRPFGARLLVADLLGGVAFAATGVLLALPYFRVAELHPYARRTVEELSFFSVTANGFVTAPAESRIWGEAHAAARAGLPWAPEMTMLPGFILYGLAVAGLFFSIWTVRQRLLLLLGAALTIVLAMGTRFFGGTYTYLLLYENLPGWDGIRTPGRLVIWTTLFLGILAAGAVGALVERARETRPEPAVPYRLGFWPRLATLVPLVLVLAEGLNVTPHPVVPTEPAAMRTAAGPMLVLPSSALIDNNVMLWSTDGFPAIVNGNSGFTPQRLNDVRQVSASFPDQQSIEYLRELGVKTVLILRDAVIGTPWEGAAERPVDGLGVTRTENAGTVVFQLAG